MLDGAYYWLILLADLIINATVVKNGEHCSESV